MNSDLKILIFPFRASNTAKPLPNFSKILNPPFCPKMPKKTALTHLEVREKLCLICRTSKNKKPGSIRKIVPNSAIHNRVKLYYHSTYDTTDIFLPAALCCRCRELLLNISKGKKDQSELSPIVLWPRDFYPPGDFGSMTKCLCPLCRIVREKVEIGHNVSSNEAKKPFPRGRPWPTEAPEALEAMEAEPAAVEADLAAIEANLAPEAQLEPSTDFCCATCTQIWDESSLLLENMTLQEIEQNCTI